MDCCLAVKAKYFNRKRNLRKTNAKYFLCFKYSCQPKAIILKLRYYRRHQMQAATLQMIIYPPEAD